MVKQKKSVIIGILLFPIVVLILLSNISFVVAQGTCAKNSQGDANCDGTVDMSDFQDWRNEYHNNASTRNADFNKDNTVNLADFEIWRKEFMRNTTEPSPSPITFTPTPTTSGPVNTLTPTPTVITTTPQPIGKGIWISPEEITRLPMTGSAWSNLKAAADSSWGNANLADNNSQHDVLTLAGALVAARTNDSAMRNKTIAGLTSATKSSLERALELSRGLQTYVIAADIIGYRDAAFADWVRRMVHVQIAGHSCSGSGLLCTAQTSVNNWGGHARASVVAAALYLNDSALLTDMANSYKAFIGVSSPNSSKMVYTDTTWHAGTPKAGVNVKGAVKNGQDLSGVIPEDWRRGGEYKWPPAITGYMWEGMQGFVVTAVLLHRANVVPFSAGENAVVRAMDILYKINNPPSGDDTWIPWVVNYYGSTGYTTAPAIGGKNMGWTDWTHAR